jgi:hypothetical protein
VRTLAPTEGDRLRLVGPVAATRYLDTNQISLVVGDKIGGWEQRGNLEEGRFSRIPCQARNSWPGWS